MIFNRFLLPWIVLIASASIFFQRCEPRTGFLFLRMFFLQFLPYNTIALFELQNNGSDRLKRLSGINPCAYMYSIKCVCNKGHL